MSEETRKAEDNEKAAEELQKVLHAEQQRSAEQQAQVSTSQFILAAIVQYSKLHAYTQPSWVAHSQGCHIVRLLLVGQMKDLATNLYAALDAEQQRSAEDKSKVSPSESCKPSCAGMHACTKALLSAAQAVAVY